MSQKKTVLAITQGVRGGQYSETKKALVITKNIDEVYSITVDCYNGAGSSYCARERAQIEIQLPNGQQWKGDILELQNVLMKSHKTR